MAYEVRLDVFQGPIDLLLHLITRRRVDIYDVSLATITDEYLQVVAAMEAIDLEAATGFLVVAATLAELKSVRLLPHRRPEDVDPRLLEERDRLLARLVECATYRDAGAWIGGGLEIGLAFHGRSVALEAPFATLAPDVLARVHVDDLARVAAEALRPRPEGDLDTSHVAAVTASVRDAILVVAGEVKRSGAAAFEELCAGAATRMEVIARFLALLELYKAGAIELDQTDRFGSIRARWTGEVDEAAVVDEAEEYTAHEAAS